MSNMGLRSGSNEHENLIKATEILKGRCADGWVERYEKEMATFT
jgi:hypothetical protein